MSDQQTDRTYHAAAVVGTIIAWVVGVTLIILAMMGSVAGSPENQYLIAGGGIVAIAIVGTLFTRNWFDDLIEVTGP